MTGVQLGARRAHHRGDGAFDVATRLGLLSLCLSSAVRTNGAFGSSVATVTTLAPSSRRPVANPIGGPVEGNSWLTSRSAASTMPPLFGSTLAANSRVSSVGTSTAGPSGVMAYGMTTTVLASHSRSAIVVVSCA